MKWMIAELKSLPDVDPAAARRLFAVEGDIVDVIVEAKKDQPVAERIKATLDGAKETIEKLGGSIGVAVTLRIWVLRGTVLSFILNHETCLIMKYRE